CRPAILCPRCIWIWRGQSPATTLSSFVWQRSSPQRRASRAAPQSFLIWRQKLSKRCRSKRAFTESPRERSVMDPVLLKYLEKYAEPEVRRLKVLGHYESALVVPAYAESDEFISTLVKQQAHRNPALPRLLILVVNERADAPAEASAANRQLLDSCFSRATASKELGTPFCTLHSFEDAPGLDLLSVDMCQPSFRLRKKEGECRAR